MIKLDYLELVIVIVIKKNIDLKNSNLLSSQWVPKVKKSINMKRNSINMNFPPKILIKNSNTGKINTNNSLNYIY